ncbi:mRNA splicing protein [Ptychographa xylographoides]|nr:mRNA splicing protein [Ptychographa xylographoides]
MSRKPAEAASKAVNEYIPNFISKKPFYIDGDDKTSDYLEHQRLQKAATDQSVWYDRGKRLGPAATKFRKGACENCGAMTHKTKDCLSRPRAKGARWTGKDIQADELVQEVELGWDAKRDRWNGYDATEYQAVIEEYEEMENLKKRAKGGDENGHRLITEDGEGDQIGNEEEKEEEEEEARYAEESDMGRKQSTATRNLRLREDTAKYLLNLDLDSAKYDPKTRSMVDMGAQADQAAALVAEENFMRASGDAAEFEKAQKYAWESQERGDKNKTHVQANPTSGEYFLRKESEERAAKRDAHNKLLLEKYGGEQHLQHSQLRNVAIVENEEYLEYDSSGAIKGAPIQNPKSKYSENIYCNNHTSVWGSWWKDFHWGYTCCHSTIKNSYCVGEDGKKAYEEAELIRTGEEFETVDNRRIIEQGSREQHYTKQDTIGEDPAADTLDLHDKKRTLAEMKGGIDEEELEAYKRSRAVPNDPMAQFLGKDELVH